MSERWTDRMRGQTGVLRQRRLVLLLALALATALAWSLSACGGGDGGKGRAGTGEPDGGEPPDDELAGTSLAGVALQWYSTLELCNPWTEGNTREEELAAKVRVALPAQRRASLGREALQRVGLQGLLVERGPLAAQRMRSDLRPEVAEYTLEDPAGDTRLRARLRYDLGELGVLEEVLAVQRARGDGRPVVYPGPEMDLRHQQGEGGAPLLPCDGGPEMEDALSVLVAADEGGRTMTLLRDWRTRHFEVSAGSYPVHLTGHRVLVSDAPWQLAELRSFWGQTYAATHHNWAETTLLDFAGDLAGYHIFAGPGRQPQQPMVRRIGLQNVDGVDGEPATLEVEEVRPGQPPVTHTWQVARPWARVDATHLVRRVQGQAPDAEVIALSDGQVRLQLLTRPRAAAPGFELLDLVPVTYPRAPLLAGQPVGPAAIALLPGDAGYQATVGTDRVEVSHFAGGGYFWLRVRDQAGGLVHEALATIGDLRLGPPMDTTFHGRSADGVTETWVTVRYAGMGAGVSAFYVPVSLRARFAGREVLVDAWDRLSYENTHHNWNDRLQAETDELVLEWQVQELGEAYTLRVTGKDGSAVLPETMLSPQPTAAACELGLPTWTGGDYQSGQDALHQFAAPAMDLVVELARLYVDGGVGESSIYELGGFSLRWGVGENVCVTDPAQLDYENSHHNWHDRAEARAGGRRYVLQLTFDAMAGGGWSYVLTAFLEGSEQPLWGPIPLERTGGPTW